MKKVKWQKLNNKSLKLILRENKRNDKIKKKQEIKIDETKLYQLSYYNQKFQ
jgi:hypothetical protein